MWSPVTSDSWLRQCISAFCILLSLLHDVARPSIESIGTDSAAHREGLSTVVVESLFRAASKSWINPTLLYNIHVPQYTQRIIRHGSS